MHTDPIIEPLVTQSSECNNNFVMNGNTICMGAIGKVPPQRLCPSIIVRKLYARLEFNTKVSTLTHKGC